MGSAKHIYAELFKTASSSEEARNAKKRVLGERTKSANFDPVQTARALGKQAAVGPTASRVLSALGGGLLGGGLGLLAGRHLLPRDPSEVEALESIGIMEPGEYSVGVSPDVFGAEEEEEGGGI